MPLNIYDPNAKPPSAFETLFALGFRPFFSLAGLSAAIMVPLWMLVYTGGISVSSYYLAIDWHAHEMLFGYTTAVIAGFLLTAVRNWTDIQTIQGVKLFLLAGLWLAGRLCALLPGVPDYLVMLIDLAFLPVLAMAVAVPVWRRRQWHNLHFVPLLLMMMLANLLVHLQLIGMTEQTAAVGMKAMLYLIVLIIVIMAGRVVAFFTERGIEGYKAPKSPWLDKLVVVALLLLAVADILQLHRSLIMISALIAVGAHLWRLWSWHTPKIWSVPLVWVLHLAYLWLVIGMAMKGLASLLLVPEVLATHAMTLGGIGGMTLGMMARVSIGHTGREMKSSQLTTMVFVLINLAAIVRVFVPMIASDEYILSVVLSSILWGMAFLLFVITYLPMLVSRRIDGRPG